MCGVIFPPSKSLSVMRDSFSNSSTKLFFSLENMQLLEDMVKIKQYKITFFYHGLINQSFPCSGSMVSKAL